MQTSANRGHDSRFVLEASIKAVISKSSQSSIRINLIYSANSEANTLVLRKLKSRSSRVLTIYLAPIHTQVGKSASFWQIAITVQVIRPSSKQWYDHGCTWESFSAPKNHHTKPKRETKTLKSPSRTNFLESQVGKSPRCDPCECPWVNHPEHKKERSEICPNNGLECVYRPWSTPLFPMKSALL